jgi:hypothetical protein
MMHTKFWWENLKRRDHLDNTGVHTECLIWGGGEADPEAICNVCSI